VTIGWDPQSFPAGDFPMPPFNGEVVSPLFQGTLDIRWDNPAILSANTPWQVVGVNLYRSDVGERGPYHRINEYPLGGSFYRDFTDNLLVSQEVIRWGQDWIYQGNGPNHRHYRFRTQCPIVKSGNRVLPLPTGVDPVSNSGVGCPTFVPGAVTSAMSGPFPFVYANAPEDVVVSIDGQVVPVDSVFGLAGEVTLIDQPYFDSVAQSLIPPVLPSADSQVWVTYRTNRNVVRYELDRKIFYRLTTVAVANDPEVPGGLVETPLKYAQPLTPIKVESLDWVWREAVRRNNWVLEQGGERVKAFVRKTAGVPCHCIWDARKRSYTGQPRNRCLTCYGSGFEGGYEGPYEIIIAPDDAERRISQTLRGRNLDHTYEVWTGPTPLLTMRDFVVKQTNERYSIGPVRKPSSRGNILQQHFNIKYLDEGDIRYRVPVDNLSGMPWPGSRTTVDPGEEKLVYPVAEYGPMHQLTPSEHSPQEYPVEPDPHQATPMATEKDNIGDSREHRGRTKTWENQNYLWWLAPFVLGLLRWVEVMSNGI